jgi:glycosyltransferase involved in cell wall biosynthesis
MLVTVARSAAEFPDVDTQFALCYEGQLAGELRSAGAAVHILGAVRASRPWTVWHARSKLRRVIAEFSPNVVVCHSPWPLAVFGPVARRSGSPLVLWLHQYLVGRSFDERWARWCRPELVVCNSQYTAASVGALFRDIRTAVVYCPCRPDRVEPTRELRKAVRAGLATPVDARVVLQASRLEWWKGHRLHLRALAELKDVPGWVCWIAGGVQRLDEVVYLRELQTLASNLGVAERVRFLGQRRDVPQLLAAADIVCHPNESPEHFGVAFVEALAAARPVVATRMGGAIEVIDASCGILVEPTVQAVASALGDLISDPARCEALGARGPVRAAELCDPSRNLSNFNATLRSQVLR